MWNYVVTAQKPTAVTHSLVGNFTGPDQLNLIVCKCTRIEIHLMTPEGLQPLLELGIYGRIATMQLYRPYGEQQDLIFLTTEKYKFCILAFDSKTETIVTKAHGSIQDRNGRPTDVGQIAIIDPETRLIGLHIYDGHFKILPIDAKSGQLRDAYNVRLEELQVIDMKFLYGTDKPTVAILYQDPREARHVKTYEVNIKDQEILPSSLELANVDRGSNMLIPVEQPYGGLLIIGEQTITYLSSTTSTSTSTSNQSSPKSIQMKPSIIKSFGRIDKERILIGDYRGILSIIILQSNTFGNIIDIKIEQLGETSISSTISYLDNSYIFIGSTYGDSQLIKLNNEIDDDSKSYIDIIELFTNLGPIVDFVVVDLEKQGQGQVVTCSGAFKDGSLRIIRNGIGINEQASIDLPGIKGLWSLRSSTESNDKYIVMSFVGQTRILGITDEELEEIELNGFESNSQTIYCGNVDNDKFVQVTNKSISLIDSSSNKLLSRWKPQNDMKINVASGNNNQLLIGTAGGYIIYIEINGNDINQISMKQLEYEISCLNINPISNDESSIKSNICVIGMWTDISVRLLRLPDLNQLLSYPLGGEIIPRSVMIVTFEDINYLLCALGDGNLITFIIDINNINNDTTTNTTNTNNTYQLIDRKKLSIGTQPIVLSKFKSNGNTHIFAASDRPTVIYSNNKKLLYSNINLKEVNYICPFNSSSFPDSLVIATEETLTIGTIDEIQKLHIRTVSLSGDMPRRIAHQESTNTFGIVTIRIETDQSGDEYDSFYFHLLDSTTFEKLSTFELDPYENPCSIISCNLSSSDDTSIISSTNSEGLQSVSPGSGSGSGSVSSYYIVGTGYAIPTEPEPKKGRILVFSVIDGKAKLISETETAGAVYSLSYLSSNESNVSNLIVAGINTKVVLYKWTDNLSSSSSLNGNESTTTTTTTSISRSLQMVCQHQGHIVALYIATRGDFIIVGDLMKSISLLAYKNVDDNLTIEEISRDYNPNWMTSVEFIGDEMDTFIGSENSYNIFTLKRNNDAATDEERSKLDVIGQYHIGEFINKFRHGSLVMRLNDTSSSLSLLSTGLNDINNNNMNMNMINNNTQSPIIGTPLLYGSVSGAIGIIANLSQDSFNYLYRVQQHLTKVIKGIGGLTHDDWRSFSNERKVSQARNFIDGDLIESFLDLKPEKMNEVVKSLNSSPDSSVYGNVTVEELTRRIEAIQQALH